MALIFFANLTTKVSNIIRHITNLHKTTNCYEITCKYKQTFYLASLFRWSLSIYCLSEFAQVQVTTPFVLPILLVSSNLQNKSIKRVCHCMKPGLEQKQRYRFELCALNKIVLIILYIYRNNTFALFCWQCWFVYVPYVYLLVMRSVRFYPMRIQKSLDYIVTLYIMDLSWRS